LITALEFNKLYRLGKKTLEIGCGEGDSARFILENSNAPLDLLDVSKEMVTSAKKNLKPFSKRIKYICEDGLAYLHRAKPYDIIFSEWTIHNFSWKEKTSLFKAIYNNLHSKGYFLFMDKVYPDKGASELLKIQNRRYTYLKSQDAKDMITHENGDYLDKHRMNESSLVKTLKDVGFRKISIIDRVERDIVLIAQK